MKQSIKSSEQNGIQFNLKDKIQEASESSQQEEEESESEQDSYDFEKVIWEYEGKLLKEMSMLIKLYEFTKELANGKQPAGDMQQNSDMTIDSVLDVKQRKDRLLSPTIPKFKALPLSSSLVKRKQEVKKSEAVQKPAYMESLPSRRLSSRKSLFPFCKLDTLPNKSSI